MVINKETYVEFDETFVFVTILKSIRLLLAINAYHNYEI
jgi:hypothetical protein